VNGAKAWVVATVVVVAIAEFGFATAHARACKDSDPKHYTYLKVSPAGNKVEEPAPIDLKGKNRPMRIVWIAPEGWVFKHRDIVIIDDNLHQQFSHGHTGGHVGNGNGPQTDKEHHWCDQNNDGEEYKYKITLRDENNPDQKVIGDPVIVNDGVKGSRRKAPR
jgi:hypothetical protein